MNKRYIIIIIVILSGIGLLIGLFLYFNQDSNLDQKNNRFEQLSVEEKRIVELSKLYFELFNTFETGDYSNMSALGAGYSLPDMQNLMSSRYIELSENTPADFRRTATSSYDDITIESYDKNSAKVKIIGFSEEVLGKNVKPQKTNLVATIILYKVEGEWMVYSLDIQDGS